MVAFASELFRELLLEFAVGAEDTQLVTPHVMLKTSL